MVSCETPQYSAEIVRLIHGDDNKAGPGYKEEVVETNLSGRRNGRLQTIHCGSYIAVARNPNLSANESFSIQAWILPTTPTKGRQGILTQWCAEEDRGYGLFIDDHGRLALGLSGRHGRTQWAHTEKPMRAWFWYFVAGTYEGSTGRVLLYQKSVAISPLKASDSVVTRSLHPNQPVPAQALFCMGAHMVRMEPSRIVGGHFNGKIDRPSLFNRSLAPEEISSLEHDSPTSVLADSVVATWDFSRDVSSTRVIDVSGHDFDGQTVNMPARAVTGHNWDGDMYTSFSEAPGRYGAIHFHDDDLEDAGWEVDLEVRVPPTLRSGIYAARLRSEDSELPGYRCSLDQDLF